MRVINSVLTSHRMTTGARGSQRSLEDVIKIFKDYARVANRRKTWAPWIRTASRPASTYRPEEIPDERRRMKCRTDRSHHGQHAASHCQLLDALVQCIDSRVVHLLGCYHIWIISRVTPSHDDGAKMKTFDTTWSQIAAINIVSDRLSDLCHFRNS